MIAGTAPPNGAQPHAAARVVVVPACDVILRAAPAPLVVAGPDAAHHEDRRQLPHGLGRPRAVQGVEQAEAVRAHLGGVGLTLGGGRGQVEVLDAPVAALMPLWRRNLAQPVRGRGGNGARRRAHRLGPKLQPVDHAHGGQHVGAGGRGCARGPSAARLGGRRPTGGRAGARRRRARAGGRLSSHSTPKSKPASSRSRASRDFQSIRPRRASAARRSLSPSRHCMSVTSASRQGAWAGCPRRG